MDTNFLKYFELNYFQVLKMSFIIFVVKTNLIKKVIRHMIIIRMVQVDKIMATKINHT